MSVVCVFARNRLVGIIEKPEGYTNYQVVIQWLRLNGYKDHVINSLEFTSGPVSPWTEALANQPEI